MNKLKVPNIEFYRLNIRYDEEIKSQANVSRDLKKILDNPDIKKNIIVKEIDLNGNVIDNNINDLIYGETITFNKWLFNISKESFGFISLKQLKEYNKELQKIYNIITEDNKLNMTYNHNLINSLIRQSFYDKRKVSTIKEQIPDEASILSIKDLPSVECNNIELQYPNDQIVQEILDKDNNTNHKIDLDSLSKEELLKLVKENPEIFTEIGTKDSIELKMSNRTFHYIPYIFSQSTFEKTFFQTILTLNKFNSSNLEVYYNGDHNTYPFRIECFKNDNGNMKKVGMYTPDFLIIDRKDNKIYKVLIIETKGKGYRNQQEFIDRKEFVENDFIPFNNKKIGYKKFDYLYIEDSLSENEIISSLNDKIYDFFKEEK